MFEIKSKLERKLLSYFLLNIEEKLYLHEIARKLDVNPANLDKKLKQLESKQLFKSEFQGNQKYYYINKKFPLLKEYRSIINKTEGIEIILKNALQNISGVKEVYIFGSYAKDSFDISSDIDLLIIGDADPLKLSKKIAEIEREMNREINIVQMSEKEYAEKKLNNNPLIKEIFNSNYIQLI